MRTCSRCGGVEDLHLVTIPESSGPGQVGRLLLYCWTCRGERGSFGVSIPVDLVTPELCAWLYRSGRTRSDPEIATTIAFGRATPELATKLRQILQQQAKLQNAVPDDGSELQWRAAMRSCRLCLDTDPPLSYTGSEGSAMPLFHEEGNLDADVLFVMEAPNRDDTFDPLKGRLTLQPDTDPSGRFFHERLVMDLGLQPEDVMVTNAVLCLPAGANGKYPVLSQQRRLCAPNLHTMIEHVDPRVVVPLGGAALTALRLVEQHKLTLRGSVAKPHSWFGRLLVPLYHPSNLGRVTRSASQQIEDYRALRRVLDSAGA